MKADIKVNGQIVPITYYRGHFLDGRARHRACQALGIEPIESELDDDVDPVAYRVAMNLHRTPRSESQQEAVCDCRAGRQKRGVVKTLKPPNE
jgi:hypothetical protein